MPDNVTSDVTLDPATAAALAAVGEVRAGMYSDRYRDALALLVRHAEERARLLVRLAEAERLLGPFADWPYSAYFSPSVPNDAYLMWATVGEDTKAPTVGHCRAAAAFLEGRPREGT